MVENTYGKTSNSLESNEKIQITGIVVTYNEERYLRSCLNSLSFCEQILVIDLGSVDKSVEISKELGTEVFIHKWVPFVEQVWPEAISLARNSWIIRADPDEVFPAPLVNDIVSVISKSKSLGIIKVPYQYYFRKRPLKTTVWGRNNYITKVFHKDRVNLGPNIHRGITCKDGFNYQLIKQSGNNSVEHYWANSYRHLFEKHCRYIEHEGESRYNSGYKFSWYSMIINVLMVLKTNLINHRGLIGGFEGVFLSFFYCWYTLMSWLSLRKYEKSQSLK